MIILPFRGLMIITDGDSKRALIIIVLPSCIFLADRPELYQLQKLESWEGRTVKVIEQVAPVWERLACALHFNPAVVATIARDNHYKCEQACMDMFGHWLNGSARQPVSWETLMLALRDCKLKRLEAELDIVLI